MKRRLEHKDFDGPTEAFLFHRIEDWANEHDDGLRIRVISVSDAYETSQGRYAATVWYYVEEA